MFRTTLELSREQHEALRQAIQNWREVQDLLERMQVLSRSMIFGTLPDNRRRKRLTKRVLGLN
jgi:hypothetical protein